VRHRPDFARYECAANGAQKLNEQFKELCIKKGIALKVPDYKVEEQVKQLSLLGI
jgi:hypothetical protein